VKPQKIQIEESFGVGGSLRVVFLGIGPLFRLGSGKSDVTLLRFSTNWEFRPRKVLSKDVSTHNYTNKKYIESPQLTVTDVPKIK
jgi:hypothetical protein